MALLPVPTKLFLEMSPDVAMLLTPFGCTQCRHPPTFPCPAHSAEAEPISKLKDIARSDKAESLMTNIFAMGPKEFLTLKVRYPATSKVSEHSDLFRDLLAWLSGGEGEGVRFL